MIEPMLVTAKDIYGRLHQVGTDRLRWRPSVYALLVQDGKLLVLPNGDRFDLPGGGPEFGEMPEAALLRETYEETGLRITAPKLLQVASSFFLMPDAPDDYVQSIMLFYTARISGGTISRARMDAGEREYVQLPRWAAYDELAGADLTSSVDWRPLVRPLLSPPSPAARQTT